MTPTHDQPTRRQSTPAMNNTVCRGLATRRTRGLAERLAVLLGLATSQALAGRPREFFEPLDPPRAIQVMVEASALGHVPPLTTVAMASTLDDPYEWLALPVSTTRDGQLLVWPQAPLEAHTTLTGKPADHSLEALLAADAGTRCAPRFAGARLMSLAQVFDQARGRINLCLEVVDATPQALVAAIEAAELGPQVLVAGSTEIVRAVRHASDGRVAVLETVDLYDGFDSTATTHLSDAILLSATQADLYSAVVSQLRDRGARVFADLRGVPAGSPLWAQVLASGVNGVRTDEPVRWLGHWTRHRVPRPAVGWAMHRGASRYAPENTRAAFELAIDLGADYIELDIHTTSDGAHVLVHDRLLDRTTSGQGPVKELDRQGVARLDAGSWFARPFAGEPVPELEPLLAQLVVPTQVQLYLDAKSIDPGELARAVAAAGLDKRAMVFQAPAYLQRVRQANADLRGLAPLYNAAALATLVEKFHPWGVDASWEVLSPELIAQAHALGVRVFSDAVGDHDQVPDYRQAIAWGIDVIQTDHPLRLLRALELEAPAANPDP